jgi:hypothetical protein
MGSTANANRQEDKTTSWIQKDPYTRVIRPVVVHTTSITGNIIMPILSVDSYLLGH